MQIFSTIPTFVWLVIIPLVASPLTYFGGRWDRENQQKDKFPLAQLISMIFLVGSAIIYVQTLRRYIAGQPMTYYVGQLYLSVDGIGLLLAGLVIFMGLVIVFFSSAAMSNNLGQEKFYASVSLMIGVMIALGFASDLFNLWVWFEGMVISSLLLVAFYHDEPYSIEAGIKYLVQSAAGTILILLGIAIVYANMGTLDLAELKYLNTYTAPMITAGILFLVGFGIKAAFVPLHAWLPDVYAKSPSVVSALMSTLVTEAGLIAMLRVLGAMNNSGVAPWGILFLIIGSVNMIFGNLMALRQTEVKRMLAYSSLTHIGYMAVGFGVTMMTTDILGASGSFLHIVTHAFMKGLGFLAIGAIIFALHLNKKGEKALMVEDLNGLSNKYPGLALFLSLALLSLGGIPPLAGFMSKWQIFSAGMGAHMVITDIVILFAGLNSVLSLAYYAPIINRMYRNEASEVVKQGGKVPFRMMLPMIVLTICLLVLGFAPSLIASLTNAAGAALVLGF